MQPMINFFMPGIIQQRWNEALAAPTLQQWRSLAVWCEDFADLCDQHAGTKHMVAEARRRADEAYRHMVALQPELAAA
jgi:hypothetical protein